MSLHSELGRDSRDWCLYASRNGLQHTTGSDPGLSHCFPQAQEGTGFLLAHSVRVPSRMSYFLLVPIGVKMTAMMIVAVVEIVIMMVEALVATAGLFSVTGAGSVKKRLCPLEKLPGATQEQRAD